MKQYKKQMRIPSSFLIMLVIWILGFTHFLGGPYLFFKVIFWISIFPFILMLFAFVLMFWNAKKILRGRKNENPDEPIHVESKIKE